MLWAPRCCSQWLTADVLLNLCLTPLISVRWNYYTCGNSPLDLSLTSLASSLYVITESPWIPVQVLVLSVKKAFTQMVPENGHWHTLFIETIKNSIRPDPGWSWTDIQRALRSFPWPLTHSMLPRELARWPNSVVAFLHCHLTWTIQVKVLFSLSALGLSIFCTGSGLTQTLLRRMFLIWNAGLLKKRNTKQQQQLLLSHIEQENWPN